MTDRLRRKQSEICPVCGGEEWTPDYDYTDDGEMRVDRCDKCQWPPPYPVTVQEWRRRSFFSEYLSDIEAALKAAEAERDRLQGQLKQALGVADMLRATEDMKLIRLRERVSELEAALLCDHHETGWSFVEHEGQMWNRCQDCGLMELWAGGVLVKQDVLVALADDGGGA
jgi:hypothetical protein